jgi:hypothetical protein
LTWQPLISEATEQNRGAVEHTGNCFFACR